MNHPTFFHSFLALAFCAGWASAQQPAADPKPLTVAVLSFDGSGEKFQEKANEAATLLAAQLSANASLWCVERAEFDKILGEHTIKLSGLTDPAHAVQVGRILGARALITGRVMASGDEGALLVVKVMSTETSRVFGETASALSISSLEKATAELAEKIGKLLAKERATFETAVEKPEARILRLKKLVENKPLPSVMVNIPEQHLARSFPDPAVETELKKTLLALGFEVIDAKEPSRQADIMIKGEAFSEAGAQRGQLVSARARVEAQVQRRRDGRVLAVDRENGVALDTSEGVAAKTSLENAAMALIERLLEKIVSP